MKFFPFQSDRAVPERPRPDAAPAGPAVCMLALEPRIMYDAAGLVAVLDGAGGEQGDAGSGEHHIDEPAADAAPPLEALVAAAAPATAGQEVVFVDPTVPDYQELLSGIEPTARIVLLDGNADGVSQINKALADSHDLAAIHIISHGGPGRLQLGTTLLGLDNLGDRAFSLGSWGDALRPGGDILLYGCNTAAGSNGHAFVEQFAALTGTDVAASTDITGHADLGGDWQLEMATGDIEAAVVLPSSGQAEWQGTLDSVEPASAAPDGTIGDSWSMGPADVSDDGRYVVFASNATNLVAGDTNGVTDVFVHDTQTGQTTCVSVDSSGGQANSDSYNPAISDDGRYVAFYSNATNLVAGDTNTVSDVFVHDTQTGQTTRVSVDSSGNEVNGASSNPSISADGRYIAFRSDADNLVATDTNLSGDIFVHDTKTGQTSRVSVDSSGTEANGSSYDPVISANGRFVAFESLASNLDSSISDTNAVSDVFVHDTITGQTTRVSMNSDGVTEADNASYSPSLSGDGRFVAFESSATNLVAGDTNASQDIFVHDTLTGVTSRVSIDSSGSEANGWSGRPVISEDGGLVYFTSSATNLVYNDTNGVDDLFVHNLHTGETDFASTLVVGVSIVSGVALSGDSRHLVLSTTSALVPADTNSLDDIYHLDLNDAPVMGTGGSTLDSINEDAVTNQGTTVTDILNDIFLYDADRDHDIGIAVTGVDNANGTWQYSTDGGATWTSFSGVSDTAATLLAGFTSVHGTIENSADLAAGDLVINGIDIGPVVLTASLNNGIDMAGAYNLYSAVNAQNAATDVLAGLGTLHAAGSVPTVGGSTTVSFSLNGVPISFATIGSTVSEIAHDTAAAINDVTDQTGVYARIGDGTNGGVADEIVLFNAFGDSSAIAISGYGEAGSSTTGLANGTYTMGPATNTGVVGMASRAGSYTIATAAGDDSILNLIGLDGGTYSTGIAGDTDGDGQIAVSADANRIRFVPDADYSGSASISFRAWDRSDGSANGATGVDVSANGATTAFSAAVSSASIGINPINDAPVVSAGGTLNYVENDPATAIDPGITLTDVDNTTIAGATVKINTGYVQGEDVLGFVNTGGITGSWNAATGTLTLTGTDSTANYQAALRSVTYQNLSDFPTEAARTVTFTANDGLVAGTPASATITVAGLVDAPVPSSTTTQTLPTTTLATASVDSATTLPDTLANDAGDLAMLLSLDALSDATAGDLTPSEALGEQPFDIGESEEAGDQDTAVDQEGEEETAEAEEDEAEEEDQEEVREEAIAAGAADASPPAAAGAVETAAGAGGQAAAAGLSRQLAEEAGRAAAEKAEILKIFNEVYELLQCK